MTDTAGLERGYRRLLACYPRAFRRENEQEILAVLLACAPEGQRRPGLAVSADLIRSALLMRLRPSVPRSARTVWTAVKLMYLGAAVAVAALVTSVATTGSVKSAIVQRHPGFTAAQWHAVLANIVIDEIAAPIVIFLLLWLAWAIGRGHGWARVVFAVFFGLTTLSLLTELAQGAAVYATADLIATAVYWAVQAAAMVLIFNNRSSPYYRQQPAQRQLT